MKAQKFLLASAAVCALAATPLRAQQTAAQPPAAPGAAPQISKVVVSDQTTTYTERRDYLLGPNDVIEVRVMNEPQLGGEFELDMDGNVEFPFLDEPVQAKCRTLNAIRKDYTAALAKFIKNPRVYVRLKEQRSRKESVIYGAVRSFQRFDMRRPVRLLELISNSGGVTEQHSGTIQIIHTAPPMCEEGERVASAPAAQTDELGLPYSIYKVTDLKEGKAEANPYIRQGDIIYVAEASPIYVVGNVLQPANLFLREGMTLVRVLAQVGGVREANEEKVKIYRQKPNGAGHEEIVVNYKAMKQGKEKDLALQPYDIIEVPRRGQFTAGGIGKMLLGAVTTIPQTLATSAPLRIIY
jgi:polysaccharide export outer membrane protein